MVRTDGSYGDYLREISKTGLLTAEEEADLAKRSVAALEAGRRIAAGEDTRALRTVQADGERARARLLGANLRLVVGVAKRYAGNGATVADLTQEGNIGLMRAVEKFDPVLGYRFSTYATYWIRQAVARAVPGQRAICLPLHVHDEVLRVRRARNELARHQGGEPSAAQVARSVGMDTAETEWLLGLGRSVRSINEPVGPEDDRTELGDHIEDDRAVSPEAAAASGSDKDEVNRRLSVLDERLRTVMRLRWGLADGTPRTLHEVGAIMGISRGSVKNLEGRAMHRLASAADRVPEKA